LILENVRTQSYGKFRDRCLSMQWLSLWFPNAPGLIVLMLGANSQAVRNSDQFTLSARRLLTLERPTVSCELRNSRSTLREVVVGGPVVLLTVVMSKLQPN